MLEQLDTIDLRLLMEDDPHFIGVFPLDRIPQNIDRHKTIKMIVNLDPHSQPGSHWVAIYRRNGYSFYFDSFGRMPPNEISNWLALNSTSWRHYNRMIQTPNDKVSCGYICLAFLNKL